MVRPSTKRNTTRLNSPAKWSSVLLVWCFSHSQLLIGFCAGVLFTCLVTNTSPLFLVDETTTSLLRAPLPPSTGEPPPMDRTTDVRKSTALTKVAGTAATVPRVVTREGGGGGGEAQGPTVRRCPDGSPAVVEVDLPSWVTEGPGAWRETMRTGSHGLTDKVNAYFFLYHLYLAKLVRRKLSCGVTNRHIKMLEVGLGCHPSGGMLQGKPGGSALGFRYLFDLLQHTGLTFELHTMEYDAACAHQFAIDHPGVTHIHTGDASSVDDLHRVVQDSGGEPFDIILDVRRVGSRCIDR